MAFRQFRNLAGLEIAVGQTLLIGGAGEVVILAEDAFQIASERPDGKGPRRGRKWRSGFFSIGSI